MAGGWNFTGRGEVRLSPRSTAHRDPANGDVTLPTGPGLGFTPKAGILLTSRCKGGGVEAGARLKARASPPYESTETNQSMVSLRNLSFFVGRRSPEGSGLAALRTEGHRWFPFRNLLSSGRRSREGSGLAALPFLAGRTTSPTRRSTKAHTITRGPPCYIRRASMGSLPRFDRCRRLDRLGDKTQLLSLLLASRFRRPLPILLAALLATILNHAFAGAVGMWVTHAVGESVMRIVLAVSFFAMAFWTLIPDKAPLADIIRVAPRDIRHHP